MKLFCLGIACIGAAISTSATAADLAIGAVCISGVDQRVDSEQDIPTTGNWKSYRYSFESGSSTGRIAVFDRPIPLADAPETCQQTIARMNALGARVLVGGRLSSLSLRASIYTSTTENRLYVRARALTARFRSSDVNLTVAGGRVVLNNTPIEVTNTEDLLTSATGTRGELRVRPNSSRITAARFRLPNGLSLVSDLRSNDNLDLRTDLATGVTRIWDGSLRGDPKQSERASFDLGIAAGEGVVLDASEVRLSADDGALSVRLAGLRGNADTLALPDEKLAWRFGASRIEAGTLEARGDHGAMSIDLRDAEIRALEINSSTARLASVAGEILRGEVRSKFEIVGKDVLSASSNWTAVRSDPLAPIFSETGIERLELAVAGPRTQPMLSGLLAAKAVRAGGAEFATPLSVPIAKSSIAANIHIPIHIDIPAASGTVKITKDGQIAQITGRLHRFYLHGDIVIPLADPAATHLSLDAENLKAGIGGAVALTPFAAGTKPNFVNADVTAVNPVDIRVGRTSTGKIALTASSMILADPVFRLGVEGTEQPMAINLVADGGARFDYDLPTGKLALSYLRAKAQGIDARLLRPNPKIDVGGIVIETPRVQIASIELLVDAGTPANNFAVLRNLTAAATTVSRGKPGGKGGLKYGGSVSKPLTVESIRASTVEFDEKLTIENFVVESVSLEISNGWAEVADGMKVSDVQLTMAIASIAESGIDDERQAVVTGASLNLSGKWRATGSAFSTSDDVPVRLSLSLNGPESALAGEGSFRLGEFRGSGRTIMPFKAGLGFRCASGEHLEVPFRYEFGVADGVTLDLKVANGQLTGYGSSGPFGLVAHTPSGGATCDSKPNDVTLVPKAEGWTWGICVKRWRVKRCKWKWSTPALGFAYKMRLSVRLAGALATMTKPRFRLLGGGKLDICNEGVLAVSPLPTWGGFSPQFELKGVPLARAQSWLINAGLSIGFEAAQSYYVNHVQNTLAWLGSVSDTTWNVGTTPFSGKGTCLGYGRDS